MSEHGSEPVEVRELGVDDLEEAWALGRLAFGGPPGAPPATAFEPRPGVTRYGAFDRTGRLVGKANDLHHEQWWGGAMVSAADIGGVAVLPEARGGGVSRSLLRAVLEGGRARGAVISALFPTVSAVYRSGGWAMVGALRSFDVATGALPRHRSEGEPLVRPGSPADAAAFGRLYTEVARVRNGMLARTGSPTGLAEDIDGLTVVVEDGTVAGLASWKRGSGYGPDAVLEVDDLLATSVEAARRLVGVLASWRSVAPTVRFRAVASGLVGDQLPIEVGREHAVAHWMHRPVDVVGALRARRWPPSTTARATFHLHDDLAAWNTGVWDLEIAGGQGHLEPSTVTAAPRLTIDGFASLYCGVASPAMLLEAGLLEGGLLPGGPLQGGPLQGGVGSMMATPAPELLDYF